MTSSLHAATSRRTVSYGFALLALSVSDDCGHGRILRSVDAPRLEREGVGCGEAGGRCFSQHAQSVFYFAQNVIANACEQWSRDFARGL